MSEIQGIEKDSISDLRIELNREIITRENFIKYQNLFKVLPEFFELAKENIDNGK